MTFEFGIYFSLAVAGWLCLNPISDPNKGRGTHAFAVFGGIAFAWCVGELMAKHAASPEDFVVARRVFFLGAAGLSPAWFWIAVRSASPPWFERRPWLVCLAFATPLLIYSCLYWDHDLRFVAWDSPVPIHGPWFDTFIAHQHVVTALGAYYFARAGVRLGRSSLPIMSTLVLGVALPLAANLAYYIRATEADWTVVALGPAGILIWFAIVHSGFATNLPIDRNEVIDQLDVGVIVADVNERILSVNAAAESLTDLGGLRGHSIAEAITAAENRVEVVIESRRIDLRGPLGVIGHALILTDRTETEAARRQLELKGRLEAIGSLTAGIAHEINNPLCYVQANLSMFEAAAKELAAPDVREDLEPFLQELVDDLGLMAAETQEGVERIRVLVQRLGNFSRSPDLSISAQPIDLEKCVRQAASVAAVGQSPDPIRLRGTMGLSIIGHETPVFQILVNLMLNAVQACSKDPEIVVEIAAEEKGVVIRIEDNGPGIPDSLLSRIFDPFYTTKATGTGLGLSLSYELVRRIGGRLEAANAEGGGAVFKLWLPDATADADSRCLEQASQPA